MYGAIVLHIHIFTLPRKRKAVSFCPVPCRFPFHGPGSWLLSRSWSCCLLSAVLFRTDFCLFPCTFTYVYSITYTYPYVYVCDLILFLSWSWSWSWSQLTVPVSGPVPGTGSYTWFLVTGPDYVYVRIALYTFYKTCTISFR